ncbi:coniferyl aldehyde dehydrogenase [Acidaminobacter sp. JC074]|uniref:coniferyl aldehyde dehydrogenase n=1 Tax=Acidaminobacter sp. JC074 TaxID=2530199 RepID=UPI001F0DBC6F|nr:coniferyl aldehyde dehydrogenase [Acidaminobacter sp. JC074]MCH4891250.1 coniferyl aldehyde dehydrogenase [Acidaminobacter sp. JC074]
MSEKALIIDNKNDIFNQLKSELNMLRKSYMDNPYPSYIERKNVLIALKKSLIKNEKKIYDAMREDYGYRSDFDSLLSDLLPSVRLINYTLKNLSKWMKPSKRHTGLLLMPSKVEVHYQPVGVVGVITPWNFPFYLALGPTIQAIAAGNRVMIKMSEDTPKTTQVLKEVLAGISEHIHVITGVKGAGSAFARLPFDHLIFTGSSNVGKLVAKSAADNLTPITLELGGKSPTVVASDANMKSAVDAIIIGKSINSGQICVAPDYIFVHESKEKEFVDTFLERYHDYHVKSGNINTQTHIINTKQLEKIHGFISDASTKGGSIHPVKKYNDIDEKLVLPHVITNVTDNMDVMKEEIFGSVLPVMKYQNIDDVIKYINERPRPLALYLMTNNRQLIKRFKNETHSGGISVNDTAMHVMADDAPFGGVGNSGMGHYHGHEGFLTFSKAKTVLHSSTILPKNKFILKNRDLVFNLLRRTLLK